MCMFRQVFLLLSLCILPFSGFCPLNAAAKPKKIEHEGKICLNMIVKNESAVIKRCLDSVKPLIDYWVIVDTGSSDKTQEIIKAHMKGIPGELLERPWKNFGDSRTEAYQLAKNKGDYILLMDADDILEFEPNFKLPVLDADVYNFWRGTKGFTYLRPQLIRGGLDWRWVGVTHEYLDLPTPHTTELLEGVNYVSLDGGARSKGTAKFFQNIALLTEGLQKEPNNARYAFYLAESYRDAGDKAKALEFFQKRVSMQGWDEEVYWSMLQIGHMLKNLGLPSNIVIEAYKNAHAFRAHRVEAIYYLAEMYNAAGEHSKAYELLKTKDFIPQPAQKDGLFNEDWIDNYGLLFQLSICSYYVGHYQESLQACDKLLAIPDVPDSWKQQAKQNRTYPVAKLQEKPGKKMAAAAAPSPEQSKL